MSDASKFRLLGTQPLNGNDARAILGIVHDWINDDPDHWGAIGWMLYENLRKAGYEVLGPE